MRFYSSTNTCTLVLILFGSCLSRNIVEIFVGVTSLSYLCISMSLFTNLYTYMYTHIYVTVRTQLAIYIYIFVEYKYKNIFSKSEESLYLCLYINVCVSS